MASLFQRSFENSRIGLAVVDLKGRGLAFNRALRDLLHDPAPAIEEMLADRMAAAGPEAGARAIAFEGAHLRRDGTTLRLDMELVPLPEDGGQPLYLLHVMQADQGQRQPVIDPVTGLGNRLAMETMPQHVVAARRPGQISLILYLDVDRFRLINDRWGHAIGDNVLRQIAGVISRAAPDATACRFSGDTFVLFLNAASVDDGARLAETIRRDVAEHAYSCAGHVFDVALSGGIAELESTETLGEALSHAGAACNVAKAAGRNRIHCFDPAEQAFSSYYQDIEWIAAIRTAIAENRMELHAQKIMGADQKTAFAVEILIRLRDSDDRLVYPDSFIPALERFGAMEVLDQWVIAAVTRFMEEQHRIGHVFVNLSGASLSSKSFRSWLRAHIGAHPQLKDRLVLEITETFAVQNLGELRDLAMELKHSGVVFAIDDFGSGFANINYIRDLGACFLKVDGRLSSAALADGVTRRIVETICAVTPQLGARTIMEHIESEDQGHLLASLGANMLQGYGMHRPEPLLTLTLALAQP